MKAIAWTIKAYQALLAWYFPQFFFSACRHNGAENNVPLLFSYYFYLLLFTWLCQMLVFILLSTGDFSSDCKYVENPLSKFFNDSLQTVFAIFRLPMIRSMPLLTFTTLQNNSPHSKKKKIYVCKAQELVDDPPRKWKSVKFLLNHHQNRFSPQMFDEKSTRRHKYYYTYYTNTTTNTKNYDHA